MIVPLWLYSYNLVIHSMFQKGHHDYNIIWYNYYNIVGHLSLGYTMLYHSIPKVQQPQLVFVM